MLVESKDVPWNVFCAAYRNAIAGIKSILKNTYAFWGRAFSFFSGEKEGKAEDLVNLMERLKWSIEQAMQALKIPENDWDEYRVLVAQSIT